MKRRKVVICGAAGRDFHNFNVLFRDDPGVEVVAFTATQIPNIAGRFYPAELAGKGYLDGIRIYPESELAALIAAHTADEVVFSYSDVRFEHVMHVASVALAAGASFTLVSPERTMISSRKPVISVCAVRTGSGKSQTSRAVARVLTEAGAAVAVIRHPMPYGDLAAQRLQRFASREDLEREHCTIEEREEYEPHIEEGRVVFAGVDYAAILSEAEKEADFIVWEGGNNDTSFVRPDLEVVVLDPHRPGHELAYHPGEVNFLRADVLVINKIDSAPEENVQVLERHIEQYNPDATVIRARSELRIEEPEMIRGRRALVVEDGPTLTHGEMKYGAGVVAARRYGAAEIVDPRPWTTGTITETFRSYPEIGTLLPAMGYGPEQVHDLEQTINSTACDVVIVATPVDLSRILSLDKPAVRVRYELSEVGSPTLADVIRARFGSELNALG